MVERDRPWDRRLLLKFMSSPRRILGKDVVTGVELARTEWQAEEGRRVLRASGETETITAGLVLRAIGYRGVPQQGLPFDPSNGTIPHRGGRVVDGASGRPVPGVYAVGWIKRGPAGGIGRNKRCAAETVSALLDDHGQGMLPVPEADLGAFLPSLHRRIDLAGWSRIDQHERSVGRALGRPRVKVVSAAQARTIAGTAGA